MQNQLHFLEWVVNRKMVHKCAANYSKCDAKNLLLSQNGLLFLHVWRRGRLALDPL